MTLARFNHPTNRSSFPSLFESFFNDEFFENSFRKTPFPSTNVKENDSAFRLELALPGYKKEHIKINLEKGLLTVEGAQGEAQNSDTEQYKRKEFNLVSFKRSFHVPDNIVESEIKAKYEDGILTLVLPKQTKAEPEAKLIEIL